MERDSLGSDAEIIDESRDFETDGYEADISVERIKSPLSKTLLPESYETAYFEIKEELGNEQRKNLMLRTDNKKLQSENNELKEKIQALEQALSTLSSTAAQELTTFSGKGGKIRRRTKGKKRVSRRKQVR